MKSGLRGRAGPDGLAGDAVAAMLADGVPPRLLQVESRLISEIAGAFGARRTSGGARAPTAGSLIAFLGEQINARADRIGELHVAFAEFTARHARSSDLEDRRQHILDFAAAVGARPRDLARDRRAFRRWFGYDTMVDRYRRRIGADERRIVFMLDRLGVLTARHLRECPSSDRRQVWKRLGLETTASRLADYDGDGRVRAAAFRSITTAIRALPGDEQIRIVSEATLRRIFRMALQPGGHVWTEVEALDLLRTAAPDSFWTALTQRLSQPAAGDDLFVRRKAVALACGEIADRPEFVGILDPVPSDPSPAVRQALALNLWKAPPAVVERHLRTLTIDDAAPEVRAAVLTSAPQLLDRIGEPALRELWLEVFRNESRPFVLRTALHVADQMVAVLLERDEAAARSWSDALLPEIERLHVEASSLAVRRWAAHARDRMWCRAYPAPRALLEMIREATAMLREGESRRLPGLRDALTRDPVLLGRVLSVLAQSDLGLDVAPRGRRITRGDRFRFRLWRMLYELLHPSTDKRQAFPHTTGRVYTGTLSAPSTIMAELAETKVPGEPFFIPDEAGWRPYLPLPDHALSAIDTGSTVRICTSEGVTEMEPPSGLFRRIAARVRLSRRFAELAGMRNWTEARSRPPSSYLDALQALGFKFRILPYAFGERAGDRTEIDPAVARFFPALVPVALAWQPVWDRLESYFFSLYSNTLPHLALFIAAVLAWFVAQHFRVNAQMRRTRAALPLVLGGWGTRGKSGTERLKAGLVNGLGYATVSKTTGCEAMFLHGDAFGQLREMFLFRPYDKATIWEQLNVADIARRLKTDVFLWECMGLTPAYVKVLQRHWTRDDVSTLTNTYPDHEDLQGPAGRNIPEVMTSFIPEKGLVLTTEEQMRPILAEAASELETRLIGVGWLEAGLLPSDALQRFPYEEHPSNIALVLALADELGVDRDFALKEMADRVVPDLGVLKAFPPAPVRTRRLEFVNGMSANERFGALSNWERMGFDRQNPDEEPEVWLTTVVNNRADRVPRSRVFASILANDISADMHVLIGSNLEGLQGYIEEAWQERAQGLTLWPQTGGAGAPDPLEVLGAGARWMRVPRSAGQAQRILRAMLDGQPGQFDREELSRLHAEPEALERALDGAGIAEAAGIVRHQRRVLESVSGFGKLAERIRSGGDRKELDAEYARLMGEWFRQKIVVIENFYALGEQVVERVALETPPGIYNRVMGIQNIKGTGLDFVYRWQAWDACQAACRSAQSSDPGQVAEGLRALAAFQEFGVLSEETVRDTLSRMRAAPPVGGSVLLDQLDLIQANFDQQLTEMRARMGTTRSAGRMQRVVAFLEGILDAGDAVRRRRLADRIYRDLIDERISHDRAALELKKLNARQKGGWFADRVQRAGDAARRAARPLSRWRENREAA